MIVGHTYFGEKHIGGKCELYGEVNVNLCTRVVLHLLDQKKGMTKRVATKKRKRVGTSSESQKDYPM